MRRLLVASLLAFALGAVSANPYLVKFSVAPYEMTVFRDGRAIVKGTEDAAVARSLYARYIGH